MASNGERLLKKIERLSSAKRKIGKKDKTEIIHELRQEFKLSQLFKVAGIARSTYYYYLKYINEEDKYAAVKTQIKTIFEENRGRYGYRRITTQLRNEGIIINHKTVQRLMKKLGLICMVRMRKYHSYKGEISKIAPNLLNRDFNSDKPNAKWVTDITEFSLFGEKLYLSTILDLYNSEIISYAYGHHASFRLVTDMLKNAFEKIPDQSDLILHSDQGWQYQLVKYKDMLNEKGLRQSMSRKGNCLDNAVMENFFGLLKSELLYLQKFDSMQHFIDELVDYINYYNNQRIKTKLNGLSPVLYRIHSSLVA